MCVGGKLIIVSSNVYSCIIISFIPDAANLIICFLSSQIRALLTFRKNICFFKHEKKIDLKIFYRAWLLLSFLKAYFRYLYIEYTCSSVHMSAGTPGRPTEAIPSPGTGVILVLGTELRSSARAANALNC